MPTQDNRKIISLATLSTFKNLLIQDFNGRYVPYSGADASVNLGTNNFITSSYFEARSVSNDVINAYTRYRAGSVVVEDSSAQNTKIINFPTASALANSNTFATQEWGLSNFLRLDIGGTVKGSIDVTPETVNRHIAVNSPTDSQSNSYAMLDTFYEDSYAYSELVLSGMSGITRYRRDYIQVGDYKINFPTLTEDSVFALDGQYLPLTGGGLTGSLSITNETAPSFHNAVLEYRTKQESETDPNSFDIIVNEARIPRPLWTTYRFIYDSSASGVQHVASREWVEDQGYTTNTGTVTSVTIGVGTGLAIDDASAITTSGTRTISIASGYKLPTTTEWNAKVNSSDLGNAAAKNYTTSVTSGSGDLVTSGAVFTAISNLPTPMQFKGTLGVGGTISTLPTASASNNGYTYKVISDITTLNAKVGDVFVSNGTSWVLIPAGDDVEDTWREIYVDGALFKGSGISSGRVNFVSGQNVTIRADGNDITISSSYTNSYHTSGSWSGLTYTATANGGAGALAFTIPTGTTASTVSRGDHTHTSFNGLTINTQTDTTPLIIQRSGSNAESVSYSVNDAQHSIVYTNDEVESSIKWTLVNTDTEGSDGSRASTHYMQFIGSNGRVALNIDGTVVSMQGHTHQYAGSSSVGGAANSANKLNTNAGSLTNPVYFANGIPVACTYSLNKTVPADAVFTDTHNTHKIISGYKQDGTTQIISASASNGNIELGASGITAGWYKRVYVNAKGIVVNGDQTDADANTWRSIKVDNVEKLGTATSTDALNFISQNTNYGDISFTYDSTNKGIKATARVPSVSNATITIKQTGISDQTFTLNGSAATITLADTNTWRPLGTGANDACAGNDSRLSNARPASDVYSWAKASTKPSYTASEIVGYLGLGDTRSAASMTWGTLTESNGYSVRLATDQGGGGGLVVAEKDGKTYLQVDGEIFVNEGASQLAKVSQIPTESTVSGWGFTKNAGTVTSVKVGSTAYNPSSGVVSLPAYPTVPTNVSAFTNDAEYITSSALNSYLPLSGGTITGNVIIQSDVSRSLSVKKGTSQQGDGEVVIHTTVISGGAEGEILIVDRMGTQTKIRTAGIFPNGLNNKLIFPSISSDETLATQEWVSSQGYTTDSVSGANDGTNWTSITINGVTKNIPSGTGSLTLDNVSDGTTRKLNKVSAGSSAGLGEAQLATAVVTGAQNEGLLKLTKTPGSQILRLTTSYYPDRIVMSQRRAGDAVLNLPYTLGTTKTLATTDQIPTVKHLYKHACVVRINYCPYLFEFYSTSNSSTSLYNIMSRAIGKVLANLYNIGEMLAITGTYTSGSYVKIDADHYYKNNNNYMFREGWSGYDVTLDQESIEEV